MPELAEVFYHARTWRQAGLGGLLNEVRAHLPARCLRDFGGQLDPAQWQDQRLESVETHGKQIMLQFSKKLWLGVHLGMTGRLLCAPAQWLPERHQHFAIRIETHWLVYEDSRQFGRLRPHFQEAPPDWWLARPPGLLEAGFSRQRLAQALARHPRTTLKGLLLDQNYFPGIGNWMADEILWQARIHPACPAARIQGRRLSLLHQTIRQVAAGALQTIGQDYRDPPSDWLFTHRWRNGGLCPRTNAPLQRSTIAGRTTCFSPQWQIYGLPDPSQTV